MNMLFRKTIFVALIAALGMAALPLVNVSAAGEAQGSNERLERVWARQLRLYKRIGQRFERADAFMEKAQNLIDRAREKGKDVSAVQAALDAFETALKNAQPLYESSKGIVNSHQGFDGNGKVTDLDKAQETVKAMDEKLNAVKDALEGTGKALREAIRAFREANPRPPQTPTPAGG